MQLEPSLLTANMQIISETPHSPPSLRAVKKKKTVVT